MNPVNAFLHSLLYPKQYEVRLNRSVVASNLTLEEAQEYIDEHGAIDGYEWYTITSQSQEEDYLHDWYAILMLSKRLAETNKHTFDVVYKNGLFYATYGEVLCYGRADGETPEEALSKAVYKFFKKEW